MDGMYSTGANTIPERDPLASGNVNPSNLSHFETMMVILHFKLKRITAIYSSHYFKLA